MAYTVMSGETSDMSQFCESEWFEWVMLEDKIAQFPNDQFKLGKDLGPRIDVGLDNNCKDFKRQWSYLT